MVSYAGPDTGKVDEVSDAPDEKERVAEERAAARDLELRVASLEGMPQFRKRA